MPKSSSPSDDANRPSDAYARKKVDAALRSARESEAGRDIGEIPKVKNKRRRAKAFASLLEFCKYFPERFYLDFCPDQIEVINETQRVIEEGGREPIAMPRGFGKTQICVTAVEWGAMTGRVAYAYLVAAIQRAGKRLMEAVKRDLLTNEGLFEDFPEVCYPIRRMDNKANLCKHQHIGGAKTWMTWSADEIVLPTVAGSVASSAKICVTMLGSSALRGSNFARPCDGRVVRPEIAVLDDVQDDRIARNPDRVEKTLQIIKGTILGMAGPDKTMTVLAPCTVIEANDVADQLLDPKRNPDWRGKTYQLVYSMPTNMTLWDEYGHIRAESLRADGTIKLATAFYKKNRREMDVGCRVAWEHRIKKGEISAIQNAMNLYYEDPATFAAEYQNKPLQPDEARAQLRAEELLASRFSGLDRGVVPPWASHLVAFVDVQQTLLYWLVAAFADDFTGTIVDYGTWPDQKRRYFTLAGAPRPFSSVKELEKADVEGAIRQALERCAAELRGKGFGVIDTKVQLELRRIGVDTGFKKDPIYDWARSTTHRPIVLPARGMPINAKMRPLSEYTKKPGERYGFHWRIPLPQTTYGIRTIQTDTNFWKTFVAERLRMTVGDRGSMSIFGKPHVTDHRLLVDHLTAEKATLVKANGREIEEWDVKPGRPDNHWWDCLVGCAALASHEGAALMEGKVDKPKRKKYGSYAEWQKSKFGSRN